MHRDDLGRDAPVRARTATAPRAAAAAPRSSRAPRALAAPLAACLLAPADAQFDAAAPEPITPPRGSFVLAGGRELPDEVAAAFRALAGDDARVVVIATRPAAVLGLDVAGAAVTTLIVDLDAAVDERVAMPIAGATAAWLATEPGDPRAADELVATLAGGAIEDALRALLARGGVIGADAGAAPALCLVRIAGGARHASLAAGLELLPGAIVDTGYDGDGERALRLRSALASHPECIGLAIELGTALVVQRRSLRAVGGGAVHAIVAASSRRPWRADVLRGRRTADLLALQRSALARHVRPFPPDDPPAPGVTHGSLVIVGGGGMPPGLLERFVELAGGADAPIVYVPCESAETIAREPGMCAALRRAGASDVTWIHTKDRAEADSDEALLAPLRRARGIWFGGGRQWNLVDSYQHTGAHALMHDVLARGGVIGGSSAGASIQSDYMPRGDPLGNLDIMAEGYEEGLGFLTGVAIDQHFAQRGRFGDMSALVDTWPQYLGVCATG